MNEKEKKEPVRLDIAFPLLVALKEMIGISIKDAKAATYRDSFKMLSRLSPSLYERISKRFNYRPESELIKYYEDMAAIKRSTVEELITKEIKDHEAAMQNGMDREVKTPFIMKKLAELKAALASRKKDIKLDEDTILIRDSGKATREEFGARFTVAEDRYTDYQLPNDGVLRIRLLHRQKAETKTGVDLIYEQHDIASNLLRIAVFQYKVWDKKVLYGTPELMAQLKKMNDTFCKGGMCKCKKGDGEENSFRMPYCTSFLRPTDKLQRPNSKLVTTGIHIPTCQALPMFSDNHLYGKHLSSKTINHEMFEYLFNHGLIGSGWHTQKEIENLYARSHILEEGDTIKVYSQQKIGREAELFM